jgi:hypothetical protein
MHHQPETEAPEEAWSVAKGLRNHELAYRRNIQFGSIRLVAQPASNIARERGE